MNSKATLTDKPSRVLTTVLGRTIQACSIVGIIYALSQAPKFLETLQTWQLGRCSFEQLCSDLLRVSAPTWLGLLFLIFIENNLRTASYSDRSLLLHPNEPWLANPKWTTPVFGVSDPVPLRAFLYFLVSIGLIAIPLAGAFTKSQVVYLIGLLATLLTIGFFVSRYFNKDWRNAELELVTFPGNIGGRCAAKVSIHRVFSPETVFSASLQCTYLLPHSSSDESDNTRRIFWSKTIEIINSHGSQMGVTVVPVQFSIPNDCPESTIYEEIGVDAKRNIRWELILQQKDAGYLGISRFSIPVFRTKHSHVNSDESFDYSDEEDLTEELKPRYEALELLNRVNFREDSLGSEQLAMTFRIRPPTLLNAAWIVGTFCMASILVIIFVVPNLVLQLFLGFLPSMILLVVLINLGEYWMWRGKIVRDGDELVVDCGVPFFHPKVRCKANSEAMLSCEVGFQSQSQAYESWNLVFKTTGEKRLLLRQFGSQEEIETVQRWLADRLGIAVVENSGLIKPSSNTPPVKQTQRLSRGKKKK